MFSSGYAYIYMRHLNLREIAPYAYKKVKHPKSR